MFKKLIALIFIFTIINNCEVPEGDDLIEPRVELLYPYAGAVISENIQVTIEASDNDKIERVWFYFDGKFIAETTQKTEKRYVIDFNIDNYKDGLTHVIQAFAEDKSDNISATELISFVINDSEDIIDPTVSVVNPQSGQNVEELVRIIAIADDDRSVKKVAFFVDGDSVHVDESYPYFYEWDTAPYADSTNHTIYAKAFDTGGNDAISSVVTVTVFRSTDGVAPVGFITYPLSGQVVFGTVNVTVEAFDNQGLSKVEFYADGILQDSLKSAPYIFAWNTDQYSDNSLHSIYAKVFDLAGNSITTELITVTVNRENSDDVTEPDVLLLYPVSGSLVSGIVRVAADVTDNREVSSVDFFIDGEKVFTDNTPPAEGEGDIWTYDNWNTNVYDAGTTHSVFVKAYDTSGNVGISSIVTVSTPEP